MDKLTRKELKTDKFAQEVTHSLQYVTGHRKQATTYAIAGLAVLLAVIAIWYWRKSSHETRQNELAAAFRLQLGVINATPSPEEGRPTFPTKEAKDAAVKKAFEDLASRRAGTDEAYVAHFMLASMAADTGDIAQAERHFKIVAEGADREYASGAKLALAQIYGSQGKIAEAERLLRELLDHPTTMVSKEQATFALARLLAASKPAEVAKLLEPLQKDGREGISRSFAQLLTELPPAAQPAPPPAPATAPKKK